MLGSFDAHFFLLSFLARGACPVSHGVVAHSRPHPRSGDMSGVTSSKQVPTLECINIPREHAGSFFRPMTQLLGRRLQCERNAEWPFLHLRKNVNVCVCVRVFQMSNTSRVSLGFRCKSKSKLWEEGERIFPTSRQTAAQSFRTSLVIPQHSLHFALATCSHSDVSSLLSMVQLLQCHHRFALRLYAILELFSLADPLCCCKLTIVSANCAVLRGLRICCSQCELDS